MPAVTCTAQASILTGRPPQEHGIVGNGWLFRETGEVRFWQQSNALLQAEPIYATARRMAGERGRTFRAAKLFWWFNQGADVAISVTPKPYYGADGNKVFGIAGTPDGLCERLEAALGRFPFHTFWGPGAGLPCTDWIARASADVAAIGAARPHAGLPAPPRLRPAAIRPVGLRHAPARPRAGRGLRPAARRRPDRRGPRLGRQRVRPCRRDPADLLNRVLREAGLLDVRPGPFGEIARHVRQPGLRRLRPPARPRLCRPGRRIASGPRELIAATPGVARVLAGEERGELGLDHPRAGDLVVLSEPDAWFAYPYWLDDRLAPDFARTVDIHRKPGYDPCELFFDPTLLWPKGRAIRAAPAEEAGFPHPLRRDPARSERWCAAATASGRRAGRGPARPDRRRAGAGRRIGRSRCRTSRAAAASAGPGVGRSRRPPRITVRARSLAESLGRRHNHWKRGRSRASPHPAGSALRGHCPCPAR